MNPKETNKPVSNFLRQIIEADITSHQEVHSYQICTRFPPEPNGYLHIGHAKSICLNFGLAKDYGGICHLRMDDTNPEKESEEFVEAIKQSVSWLGFNWQEHFFYSSDYFERFYQCAVALITAGLAYVDSQSSQQISQNRGSLTEVGKNSPFRTRSPEENLALFTQMRTGELSEGQAVLRAKIDMASPNFNMRDPVLYRIRHISHYRSLDTWKIYPLYDYAHPLSDAFEGITHSLCTLEFEDHRPFYEWLIENLAQLGQLTKPLPKQYEFARLNLSHTVTSKRRLKELVDRQIVDGWDDPRLPTLLGIKRRGYTASSIHLFCERIGIAKADSWIHFSTLETALRDDLDPSAARLTAVINPLALVITNYPEDISEDCFAPVHPHHAEMGKRRFPFSQKLWFENEDFMETPIAGFHRLSVGKEVRLRYGYIIKCTHFEKNAEGKITCVYAEADLQTKSGTPGARRAVKGNIHWLSQQHAISATAHLFDNLFLTEHPDAESTHYWEQINPHSKISKQVWLEPEAPNMCYHPDGTQKQTHFQFERQGYFVIDKESSAQALVFNRAVTLKIAGTKLN